MELKPGYKETEIGIIPVDWDVDCVENIGHVTTGSKNTQDRIEDGDYPFFVRSQTVERINTYSFEGEAVLTAGDGVGTGKVFHYINGKFDVHQRVYRISDFSPRVNGYFFYLYFSRNFYNRIMQMTAKSSVDSVRRDMITRMMVPLPTIEGEQDAISQAIRDADCLLDGLDRLIAKKRDLKQAAMQQLLNGETRLPGFTGEWKEKRLGELGVFLKGSGVKKDDSQSGPLPCVRYGEIYTHHNEYIKNYYSFISPDVAGTAQALKQGDILFAGSGETREEIGKCTAFIDDCEAYAGGDIVIFRSQGLNPLFLGFCLNMPSVNRQKASKGQGDAVVHISAAALSSIVVNLPPEVEEQTAIATVLSDMDTEIATLEKRRNKTKDIKQAMMQELLTGKTRLVTPGGSNA